MPTEHEHEPSCPECGSPLPEGFRRFCSALCRRRRGAAVHRASLDALQAAGLCKRCAEPTDGLHKLCLACRLAYRPKVRKNQLERKKAGLCIRCGRPRKRPRQQCALCLAYATAWRESRRGR